MEYNRTTVYTTTTDEGKDRRHEKGRITTMTITVTMAAAGED